MWQNNSLHNVINILGYGNFEKIKYLTYRVYADKISNDLECVYKPNRRYILPNIIISPYMYSDKDGLIHPIEYTGSTRDPILRINRNMLDRFIYCGSSIMTMQEYIKSFMSVARNGTPDESGSIVYFLVFTFIYSLLKTGGRIDAEYHQLMRDTIDTWIERFLFNVMDILEYEFGNSSFEQKDFQTLLIDGIDMFAVDPIYTYGTFGDPKFIELKDCFLVDVAAEIIENEDQFGYSDKSGLPLLYKNGYGG